MDSNTKEDSTRDETLREVLGNVGLIPRLINIVSNFVESRYISKEEHRKALLEARINTYQRIMLWLENQDDNDQLALLGKDISIELDNLFAQLQESEKHNG